MPYHADDCSAAAAASSVARQMELIKYLIQSSIGSSCSCRIEKWQPGNDRQRPGLDGSKKFSNQASASRCNHPTGLPQQCWQILATGHSNREPWLIKKLGQLSTQLLSLFSPLSSFQKVLHSFAGNTHAASPFEPLDCILCQGIQSDTA